MNNEFKKIIIVGAGPAGIFTALELIKKKKVLGSEILIIEKGKAIENRNCPISKIGECVKCNPECNITSGFAGAGAFSDAKLSLYNKDEEDILIGGNLPELLGNEYTKKLIDYCDNIYLEFGGDKKISGLDNHNRIEEIKKKAKSNNITLIDIPVRHLGTEKSRELYFKIEQYLLQNDVEILFNTNVIDLIIDNNKIKGVKTSKGDFFSDKVVMSVGRKGANFLSNLCDIHNISKEVGTVDIGIRYELKTEKGIEEINNLLYEGKFIAELPPFKDKVRTFCQNPNGFVSAEVYDGGLSAVNGHAFKEKKSTNTNLAILSSHKFTIPFHKPIEYGEKIGELVNLLSNGDVVVQRFGDLLNGKRTWENELKNNSVKPTLPSAKAGDISLGIPYRIMTNIINFILSMENVVEGFANEDNLMYAPEIKFYSNSVKINKNYETNINGLYAIGDGAGITRGLMMASCSGVDLANKIEF